MPEQENKHNPVAANTLFHFTSSMKNLENILTVGFQPRYCLEDFSAINEKGEEGWEWAYPMVCFCDIPLSQIRNHISKYGRPTGGGYGIGLSKSWGTVQGITPVMYIHKSSPTLQFYINLQLKLNENYKKIKSNQSNLDLSEAANMITNSAGLARYLKPYKGKMWDKNNHEFAGELKDLYEEREWRYSPFFENQHEFLLSSQEYKDATILETANSIIASKNYKLSFEPNDIKYIIVNTEAEIPEMIEKIREKYSDPEKDLLITRIISMDHILADF